MQRRYVFAALFAAIAALALVSVPVMARSPGSGSGAKPEVKRAWIRVMDNFFDPRAVNVVPDTKVTFNWRGNNRHNVRFTKVPKGASRKGSKIQRTGRWSRALTVPGQYRYVCTLFAGMRGTITVKPPNPNPNPQ
jgi:plastocyanin